MLHTKNNQSLALSEPAQVQVGLNSFIGMGSPKSLHTIQHFLDNWFDHEVESYFDEVIDMVVTSDEFALKLSGIERQSMMVFLRDAAKFCQLAYFLFDDEFSREHLHEFDKIRESWNTELSDRYASRTKFLSIEQHVQAEDLKSRKSRRGAASQEC